MIGLNTISTPDQSAVDVALANVQSVMALIAIAADPVAAKKRMLEMDAALAELAHLRDELIERQKELQAGQQRAQKETADREAEFAARERKLAELKTLSVKLAEKQEAVARANDLNAEATKRLEEVEASLRDRIRRVEESDRQSTARTVALDAREARVKTQEEDIQRRVALIQQATA